MSTFVGIMPQGRVGTKPSAPPSAGRPAWFTALCGNAKCRLCCQFADYSPQTRQIPAIHVAASDNRRLSTGRTSGVAVHPSNMRIGPGSATLSCRASKGEYLGGSGKPGYVRI